MSPSPTEHPKGLPIIFNLVQHFEGNAEIRFNLVRSLMRRKQYEEALEQVSIFIVLKMHVFRANMIVAEIYSRMGKHSMSLSWLRTALASGYDDPLIYEKMGYNYMCLNMNEAAERAYERAGKHAADEPGPNDVSMSAVLGID